MPILVDAPSRLHFGLFAFGDGPRCWGGLGLMLDRPRILLRATAADQLSAVGSSSDRVLEFAERWRRSRGQSNFGARFEVLEDLAPHQGLGSGTALALSVAAALNRLAGAPEQDIASLAHCVGRGGRSAVGSHGFRIGGLIMESGRSAEDGFSPLAARHAIDEDWRFALLRPVANAGLSGAGEQRAFETLPSIPFATTERLTALSTQVAQAAAARQFELFAESLHEFGREAGTCFADVQGGPYNGRRIQRLVSAVRDAGYPGVGQSSWGPTVYVATRDEASAAGLLSALEAEGELSDLDVQITAPRNTGATIVEEQSALDQ